MCILLFSTAHPEYPIIILSNRDEFLHRATQRAAFWEAPNSNVYSGRDLARPEKGTWLGVSRNGRVAFLTNFREPSSALAIGEKSRGAMVTSFLTSPEPVSTPTKDWIHKVLTTGEMKGVGGFSLLCGTLRPNGENLEELAVISNRTVDRDEGVESAAHWVAGKKGETHGLSNSLFDDPWPKVKLGEQLLSEMLKEAANKSISDEELLEKCFGILSHDTLPKIQKEDSYEKELNALPHSIFIPPFDAAIERHQETKTVPKKLAGEDFVTTHRLSARDTMIDGTNAAGKVVHLCTTPVRSDSPLTPEEELERWRSSPRVYGTQTQTVILVNKAGHLKYVERRLFDEQSCPIEGNERDVVTEFDIEGWGQ
ncbi:NRDE protein-domain-containing protein [Geopyxis carbonaria]|nr:NRDE protein-domain-containing protein [Geopyxis carbonaria]